MHLLVPLLHKKVEKLAANFRACHGKAILNENPSHKPEHRPREARSEARGQQESEKKPRRISAWRFPADLT
jgi:hypothetical protein